MQQKNNIIPVVKVCFCYVHLEPMLINAKSQYYIHVYNISLHDQSCMEVVSLEFNILHGMRMYAHSSAKVYFESYHSDYDMNDCCEAYIEIIYIYQGMYF